MNTLTLAGEFASLLLDTAVKGTVLLLLASLADWFHPLAWFALRQLRQEREQACDDAVVQSGERASDYAEQLLRVARLCCTQRGLSLGVAMAEGSSIERRIVSLFDSARGHGPLTRRVAIAAILIGGTILVVLASIKPTVWPAKPIEETSTFRTAIEATVDINTSTEADKESPSPGGNLSIERVGSGMIIDAEGYVVTANQVVLDANSIQVTLHDGTVLPASVVGKDPVSDLAVLRIHAAQPLTVMPEQHQTPLKAGDEVAAIWNSEDGKHSVARGIVSSLERDVVLNGRQKYKNIILTDLSLDPGGIGGPLLNSQGEAIGINIAQRRSTQNIGFAIPIQDSRKVFVGLKSSIMNEDPEAVAVPATAEE